VFLAVILNGDRYSAPYLGGSYEPGSLIHHSTTLGKLMAVGQNQKNRKNDPMLTKTGKTRLGPLNTAQLTKLMETSTKAKEKGKIQRALNKQ
jgi:hypothetical protein